MNIGPVETGMASGGTSRSGGVVSGARGFTEEWPTLFPSILASSVFLLN